MLTTRRPGVSRWIVKSTTLPNNPNPQKCLVVTYVRAEAKRRIIFGLYSCARVCRTPVPGRFPAEFLRGQRSLREGHVSPRNKYPTPKFTEPHTAT